MGAIILEVAGTLMLPLSQNFSKPIPTVTLAILLASSFYLLTHAVKVIPLSVVYATWSGVGVFLVAIMSYVLYGDLLKWPAILGLFLIVGGVVLVNTFSVPHSWEQRLFSSLEAFTFMSDKTTSKGWFRSALSKLNRVVSEDMSEYDEDADYDTRVKLPEWQLAALKKRKRDQKCQQK